VSTNDAEQATGLAIDARDLVKTYPGQVEAVRGVSFGVERGEAFGLVGPNGAGKTTTIGMLNTTVRPTSGRALLGGVDVAADPVGARSISSVVFQDAVVDRPLSGRQNLSLHLRLWGADGTAARGRLDELVELVGLTEQLDRPVSTYSGGERRRLEIVRALSSEPEVLFLDEPTVGLDTRVRHDLFDVIASLRERTGVTVLMTTHYLDEAERLCDRVAVIEAGRIVGSDSPARLRAALGREILEIRVESPDAAVGSLAAVGVAPEDVVVVGGTLTAILRSVPAERVLSRFHDDRIGIRSVTTRQPTLDDAYLRLTGGRIAA
jgi:ABC-2 type transport system ATP-binding protein